MNMGFMGNDDIHITLLNLECPDVNSEGFSSTAGNACDLSEYQDKYFDIVFSNSVIEHLFTFANQARMANEVRRVGKNYVIQTPNRYFPIEPHWLLPMFQFLPFSLKLLLTNKFSLGHYPRERNLELAKRRVEEVRLLTKAEMIALFPDGQLYEEKVLGLNKSLTMYKFN
jgi:SAM-dependent methyltransferase